MRDFWELVRSHIRHSSLYPSFVFDVFLKSFQGLWWLVKKYTIWRLFIVFISSCLSNSMAPGHTEFLRIIAAVTIKNCRFGLRLLFEGNYSAFQKNGSPKIWFHSNATHAVSFNCTITSYGLFESLLSQLLNELSFDSRAAHLRSRSHGKEKVHVF